MLKQRVITALILAPLMLGGIFLLPLHYFKYFIALICTLGAWEWANISGISAPVSRLVTAGVLGAVLVFFEPLLSAHLPLLMLLGACFWLVCGVLVKQYPKQTELWSPTWVKLVMGVLALVPMWAGFVFLKQQANSGLLITCLMLIVWGADTGAYFAGRQWGKKKLAPNVSPGKSWAGVWGGLAVSVVIVLVFMQWVTVSVRPLSSIEMIELLLVALITFPISVLGDLFESMHKRHRGIKDSSNLLPGHGGVMDRIDSMSSAVPVFACLLWLFGWSLG